MNLDDIWMKITYAYKVNDERFPDYVAEFKTYDLQWLEYLRQALLGNSRVVAFSILAYLNENEKIDIFDLLVYYSSFTHGSVVFFHDTVLSLPKEWVTKNIERYANPILEGGDEDEYRRVLELYFRLDHSLALRLAKHAVLNNNLAIREVGEEFINAINESE
jgi:hypothetical protein